MIDGSEEQVDALVRGGGLLHLLLLEWRQTMPLSRDCDDGMSVVSDAVRRVSVGWAHRRRGEQP
jgi:hypothetical protein